MWKQKIKDWWPTMALALLMILAPRIFGFIFSSGVTQKEVRSIIKEKLYQEYGEEFVVDRLGSRSSRGEEFYRARIYPKYIVGTPKEGDEYYYGTASIDKDNLEDGGVGDTYGELKRSLEIEDKLLGRAKELFGQRVLLKVEQMYEKRNSKGYFVSYLDPSYKEVMNRIKKEPDQHRLLLELDLYIFDRIDNKEEKEKRRREIFNFVQYLKEEGLFEYLELGVIFIDERVLAPSYKEFDRKVYFSEKVEKEIAGEIVMMPPMKLRKKMSKVLGNEVNEMNKEELLISMNKIQKDELNYKELDKYNASHYSLIYSVGILKTNYNSSYKEYKKNKTLEHYYYKTESDIKIGKNLEYIYIIN